MFVEIFFDFELRNFHDKLLYNPNLVAKMGSDVIEEPKHRRKVNAIILDWVDADRVSSVDEFCEKVSIY